jgi:hypothetical protein
MNPKLGAVLLLAGTALAAQTDSALLFSDCSDSSEVKRVIQSSDMVVVRHSLEGGPQTCYAVSVSGENGNVVQGFLLDSKHPAVLAFERKEQDYIAQVFTGPSDTKQNPPKPVARAKAKPYKFWNPFSSRSGTK